MQGFSKHFTFEELTNSEDHQDLVPQNRKDAIKYVIAGKRLSKLLESIRHILGDNPIHVNSGFRNEELNKSVGGVDKVVKGKKILSSHRRFEACDIVPEMNLKEAFNALLMAHKGGLIPDLRKCIIEKNAWLHIETKMSIDDQTFFFTSIDGITFTRVA